MDGGEDENAFEAGGSGGPLVAEREAENAGGIERGEFASAVAGAVERGTGVGREAGTLVDGERQTGSGGREIFEAGGIGVPEQMPAAAGDNRQELRKQLEGFRLDAGEFETQGAGTLCDE